MTEAVRVERGKKVARKVEGGRALRAAMGLVGLGCMCLYMDVRLWGSGGWVLYTSRYTFSFVRDRGPFILIVFHLLLQTNYFKLFRLLG